MKTIKIGAMALATLVVSAVQAQTADEIIAKHIDAIGGHDKIAAIKTMYLESSVEVGGNEAPSTTYILNGKAFKSEMDFGGQKIVQCYTDKGGWTINPMMGQTTATPLPDSQAKLGQSQFQVGGQLLDYASKGNKVELLPRETVNGVNAYKVKLTTPEKNEYTYFFDPTTYYLIQLNAKVSMGGQEQETSIAFSNYKKTDYGFVVPMSQQVTLPQITLSITNNKVEINKDIDPKIFELPKS